MNLETLSLLAKKAAGALDEFAAEIDRAIADRRASRTSTAPAPSAAPGPQRPAPRHEQSGAVAPFGRAKGELLANLETKDLRWLAEALERSISDSSKGMYRRKNEVDAANVRAEILARGEVP